MDLAEQLQQAMERLVAQDAEIACLREKLADASRKAEAQTQTREALQQSEEKYRNLVEQISDWVWEIDEHAVLTYVSPRIRELLGYEPEEMIGKTPFDFMPPDEARRVASLFTPIATRHEPFTLAENTMVRKDGHTIVVEVSSIPLVNDQGRFLGYRGIDRDITDRKRAEAALEESEALFRLLTDSTQGLIYIHEEQHFVYANPSLTTFSGYTTEELMAMGIHDLLHPEERARIEGYTRHGLLGDTAPERYEARVITRAGEEKWLEFSPTLIEFHGQPAILGTAYDITEWKHAEEALFTRTEQLAVLIQASREMNSVLEISAVMRNLVKMAMESVDATSGAAGIYQDGQLVFSEYNEQGTLIPIDYRFPSGYGVPGWVMATMQPYLSNDAAHDPHVIPALQQALNFYNLIDTPIISRSGELLGCFELHNKVGHAPFTAIDVSLLEALASSAAVALENARLVAQLQDAEMNVRRERDQSQRYLDIASVILVAIDADQSVSLINKMGCAVLGYPQEEILGRNWYLTFIPASVRAQVEEASRLLMAGESAAVEYFENLVLTKDGTERLIAWHSTVLRDDAGLITGMLSSGEDITARRQSEEKTRQLAVIVERSHDFIGVATLDQHAIYVNTAGEELVGLEKDRFGETWIEDFFLPEDLPFLREMILPTLLREGRWSGEFRFRHFKTGKPIPVFYDLFRVEDIRAGEPTCFATITRDITERKRAEVALRESESLLRAVVDNTPFEFWARDTEGRAIMENAALVRHWGSLAGSKPEDTDLSPAELALWLENNRRALAGEVVEGEIRYTVAGEPRIFRNIIAPIYQGDEIRGTLGFNIDITELKRTEAALLEAEQRYRTVFEESPDAIFIERYDGQIIDVNIMACKTFGRSKEELIGGNVTDMVHPSQREQQIAERHLWVSGALTRSDGIVHDAQGNIIALDIRASHIVLAGEPVLLFHLRDITDRKHAEEALEKERALLATGIDILPFPIIFETASGEILRANRAAHVLHTGQEMLTFETRPKIPLLEPGTRHAIPDEQWPERRALRGETISSVEYLLIMPDGREMPVLAQAAPIYVKDELIGVVLALQEISKLKEADQAKDQFLMVLSHELKTPLTSILGWAQAALNLPDQAPQALGIIVRNAQEQSRILEDLLDVSRLVTGRLSLQQETKDLWELAHLSAESAMQAAQSATVTLCEEPPSEALPVLADSGRLRQAIGNLLNNAIKFTEPGGQIWVRAYRRGETAVLEVQDTGQGIAPEEISNLFRPFLQLHREEQKGGLGLGLSLVKGIVELHGGQVEAASPGLGQGSTFTITLPLDRG